MQITAILTLHYIIIYSVLVHSSMIYLTPNYLLIRGFFPGLFFLDSLCVSPFGTVSHSGILQPRIDIILSYRYHTYRSCATSEIKNAILRD